MRNIKKRKIFPHYFFCKKLSRSDKTLANLVGYKYENLASLGAEVSGFDSTSLYNAGYAKIPFIMQLKQ